VQAPRRGIHGHQGHRRTGHRSNRGIGWSFVEALIERGATKIYASARQPAKVADLVDRFKGKVVVLKLDITDSGDIAAAAKACRDVTLLLNNAGINLQAGLIAAADLAAACAEIETNYFGPLSMCRAFAPILTANGGGAIVNMLSGAREPADVRLALRLEGCRAVADARGAQRAREACDPGGRGHARGPPTQRWSAISRHRNCRQPMPPGPRSKASRRDLKKSIRATWQPA
jgi:hypothetical protein